MATHSSILDWEVPWTEEPGGLQSMGSQKNQTCLSDERVTTGIAYQRQVRRMSLFWFPW